MNSIEEYTRDTSTDYEDLVGYVAQENIVSTLDAFLGNENKDYKPPVMRKKQDPEFPESWQSLYVNFPTEQDYIDFMFAIGEKPVPKLNTLVYSVNNDEKGLLDFIED
jgi:hypothetical protein